MALPRFAFVQSFKSSLSREPFMTTCCLIGGVCFTIPIYRWSQTDSKTIGWDLPTALAEEEQYYRDPSPAKHEPSTRFRPFPFHVSRHKPDTWPEVLISKWNDQARLHAEDLRRPVWERYFGSSASGRSFKEIYFGHAPQSKEYWEKKKVQWAEQDGATSTH